MSQTGLLELISFEGVARTGAVQLVRLQFLNRNSAYVRAVALAMAIAILILSQLYVSYNQTFDASTFLLGVGFPLVAGSLLIGFTRQNVLLLAYLGYFWSVVDDGPVYLDSVFTWPEVTRFNPALPHFALEVLFHLLTLSLILLSIRKVVKTAHPTIAGRFVAYITGLVAFVLAYAQNVPLNAIQSVVENSWYQLDVLEHLVSILVFYLALLLAGYSFRPASSKP